MDFSKVEYLAITCKPAFGVVESDLTLGSVELEEPDAITGRQTVS